MVTSMMPDLSWYRQPRIPASLATTSGVLLMARSHKMWAVSIVLSILWMRCQVQAVAELDLFGDDIEFEAWSEASDVEGAEFFRIDGSDEVVRDEIRKRVEAPEPWMLVPEKKKRPAKKADKRQSRQNTDIDNLFTEEEKHERIPFMTCQNKQKICDIYQKQNDNGYCELPAYKDLCLRSCDEYHCDEGEIETCGSTEECVNEMRITLAQRFGAKLQELEDLYLDDVGQGQSHD